MINHHFSRKALATAFTLVELMIAMALVAIIIALAAPSFRDMILMQRLRGINAQMVTDLALARSEAVSRGVLVNVRSQSVSGMSCYIINTRTSLAAPLCDCTAGPGLRCASSETTEIRTVQILSDMLVQVEVPTGQASEFTFDPRTGGMKLAPSDFGIYDTTGFQIETFVDSARKLRTAVNLSGRASVCTPSLSQVGGSAC